MRHYRSSMFVGACLLLTACGNIKMGPQIIVADGETYAACGNLVWISEDGGGLFGGSASFKVSFTDSDGLDHQVRGIKKLSVGDLPTMVAAPMPYPLPMTWGADSSGNTYKEGVPYTWADGSQAQLRNGVWKPVMVANTACKQKKSP